MDLRRCYLIKNPCYKKGTKITPVGIIVHSTGANNPYIKRYVQPDDGRLGVNTNKNDWNNSSTAVCVHAFIGYDKNKNVCIYETLPYNIACWGCGNGSKGSFNYNPTAHIQFEICEDGLNDRTYFYKAMKEAQEYCAYLCKMYGFGVDKIVDHATAHKLGYASNHSDIGQWLSIYGLDLAWFRNCVQEILTPSVTEFNAYDVKIINTDGTLNIRENHLSSSKINGTINDGDVVSVNGSCNGWLRLTNGMGWIFATYTKNYVNPVENVTPQETPQKEVVEDKPVKTIDNTKKEETAPVEDNTIPAIDDTTSTDVKVDDTIQTDTITNETPTDLNSSTDDNTPTTSKTGFIAGLVSVFGGLTYMLQKYWYIALIALLVAIILIYIFKNRKGK